MYIILKKIINKRNTTKNTVLNYKSHKYSTFVKKCRRHVFIELLKKKKKIQPIEAIMINLLSIGNIRNIFIFS